MLVGEQSEERGGRLSVEWRRVGVGVVVGVRCRETPGVGVSWWRLRPSAPLPPLRATLSPLPSSPPPPLLFPLPLPRCAPTNTPRPAQPGCVSPVSVHFASLFLTHTHHSLDNLHPRPLLSTPLLLVSSFHSISPRLHLEGVSRLLLIVISANLFRNQFDFRLRLPITCMFF